MRASIVVLTIVLTAVAAVPYSGRISGGAVTTIGNYPFAATLTHNRLGIGVFQIACGGSIITHRAVLTAAYCLYNEETNRWRIRVGAVSSNGAIIHTADNFVVHPRYNPVTKENDIAIIHVFPHFLFTSTNVQLGSLPPSNYIPPLNQTVFAIGWGATTYGGAISESLRRVQLWIVENRECKNRYNELNGPNVTHNMICAVGLDVTGRGQCLGDNGSPLLHDKVIIGLYSWSHQCGTVRYPGVNTFIPAYLDWIKANY